MALIKLPRECAALSIISSSGCTPTGLGSNLQIIHHLDIIWALGSDQSWSVSALLEAAEPYRVMPSGCHPGPGSVIAMPAYR